MIKILKPKKAILTNLHSKLDYNLLKKNLPKNVIPAFDGLTLNYKIFSICEISFLDIGFVKELNVFAILPSLFIRIL